MQQTFEHAFIFILFVASAIITPVIYSLFQNLVKRVTKLLNGNIPKSTPLSTISEYSSFVNIGALGFASYIILYYTGDYKLVFLLSSIPVVNLLLPELLQAVTPIQVVIDKDPDNPQKITQEQADAAVRHAMHTRLASFKMTALILNSIPVIAYTIIVIIYSNGHSVSELLPLFEKF